VEQAGIDEKISDNRAKLLAIQRCRRGGKTFMLHAVASMINNERGNRMPGQTVASMINNERGNRLPGETHVILISLNSRTPYSSDVEASEGKGALFSILSRIAWECPIDDTPLLISEIATMALALWMNGYRNKSLFSLLMS
jgi:hypothetical protein